METYPKLNPLSRNPNLTFHSISVSLESSSEMPNCIGRAEAMASLPGYQDTKLYFRILRINDTILLGSRCGLLHTPHINARSDPNSSETLWCTNCWTQTIVPFYLYYRHYEHHVISHMPSCSSCGKRFQVWEDDEPLKENNTYLFSAIVNPRLLEKVTYKIQELYTRAY
jgi:hypothetical protein